MTTKLYRSEIDKMLGGVCGGLGRYLGIDPTIVRLFFVLLTVANGVGVFIYFVLWLIVPGEDQAEGTTVEETIRASADEIAERARALGDEVRVAAQGPPSSGRCAHRSPPDRVGSDVLAAESERSLAVVVEA